MSNSIENKILKKIRGHGSGWAFSAVDLAHLGSRTAIDVTLSRLNNRGVIRRVLRGIYDYPKFSSFLNETLSPDMDEVARALARKFGWKIEIDGLSALNYLGISTQVPGRLLYSSNGPNRTYKVTRRHLEFRHVALKDSGFKMIQSTVIVQAIKALGADHVSEDVIEKIRDWLDKKLRDKVLLDSKSATGWVYAEVKKICRSD